MRFTRRDLFCLAAGAARPMLAQAREARTVQAAREPRTYYGGLRMAISGWCFGKLPLNQLTAQVTALRLKYLELSPAQADLTAVSTTDLRSMRAQLLDAGLSVHDYGVLQLRGKSKQQRRELETIFRRAEEFGFESLIIDPDAALLRELDRLARRFRVNVALINRSGGYATAEAISGALDSCSDRFGAAIDTAAFLSAGRQPAEAIARLKSRIFVVHLTDLTASGKFCAPGKGTVDFAGVFQALREARYDNVVTLSCEGLADQAGEAIAQSLDYFKKITGGQ